MGRRCNKSLRFFICYIYTGISVQSPLHGLNLMSDSISPLWATGIPLLVSFVQTLLGAEEGRRRCRNINFFCACYIYSAGKFEIQARSKIRAACLEVRHRTQRLPLIFFLWCKCYTIIFHFVKNVSSNYRLSDHIGIVGLWCPKPISCRGTDSIFLSPSPFLLLRSNSLGEHRGERERKTTLIRPD